MTEDGPVNDMLIVGLGEVATTHLRVLENNASVRSVAGVDPHSSKSLAFRDAGVPVYPSLDAAKADCAPTAVVVAVPTPQHVAVTGEVFDAFPTADVFVEKPLADNWHGAQQLFDRGESRAGRFEVFYHMAFSPEVLWARHLAENYGTSWGALENFECWFSDAYAKDIERASATLGDSWLDSGINALSVLQWFADVGEIVEFRELNGEWRTYEAILSCVAAGGKAIGTILTTWGVTEGTRETRLRFRNDVEVVLDHAAVAGRVLKFGKVHDLFGTDGMIPRRELHYRNLYRVLWDGQDSERMMSSRVSRHLHRLLLAP